MRKQRRGIFSTKFLNKNFVSRFDIYFVKIGEMNIEYRFLFFLVLIKEFDMDSSFGIGHLLSFVDE